MNEKLHVQNFIDGTLVDGCEGQLTDLTHLTDPSTGEVFGDAPLSGQADIDLAYESAARAFGSWKRTTPSERQQALLKFADLIEANVERLVEAESRNTGKIIAATLAEEMPPMIDQIRFFAGVACVLEGKSAGKYMSGLTSWVRREPVGVVGQVAPWNYPMMMGVWKFAAAVAAGNTVVLKPSDTIPVSSVMLAQLAAECMPAGVLNVVCGDRSTGNLLVSHPTPQMVSITGSVAAGRQVAAAAAEDLKRVHLELGGKAPVIVFGDADLAAAAQGIAEAGYFNAGQDCTSATRVLVHASVRDDFVAALAEQARGATTSYEGGRTDEDAWVPPVNNVHQFERVCGFLNQIPDHATIVAGGGRQGDRGYYIEPTVISGLDQQDELIQQEVFGPVITVRPSRPRKRRSPRRTAYLMRSPRRCGPGIWARRFGCQPSSTSDASGSTRISRWWPRCPTGGSSTRATARTCRCTASRTTPASST